MEGPNSARWALRTLAAEDRAGWVFIAEGQMLLQLRLELLLQAHVHAALLTGEPSPPCPACPNPFHVPKLNSGVLCPGSLPAVVPSQATASPSCSGFSTGLCHRKPGHRPADHHTAQLIPTRTLDTSTAELVSFPFESCRHGAPEEDGGLLKWTELQPLHDFKPGSQNPWSSFPSLELCFSQFSSIHPFIQCSPQPFLYLSGGHTGNGMESEH